MRRFVGMLLAALSYAIDMNRYTMDTMYTYPIAVATFGRPFADTLVIEGLVDPPKPGSVFVQQVPTWTNNIVPWSCSFNELLPTIEQATKTIERD